MFSYSRGIEIKDSNMVNKMEKMENKISELYTNQEECNKVLELKDQGYTHNEALQTIQKEKDEYLSFLSVEDLEMC